MHEYDLIADWYATERRGPGGVPELESLIARLPVGASVLAVRTLLPRHALWTLARDEKLASCEIAFVPIGVKATVMRNGKLLYSRIFATGDDAVVWAEEERKGYAAKGWTVTDV